MRFKDFDHFRSRHSDLADLLEKGGHAFLSEMKARIDARDNMTPKQMKALKAWAERDKATAEVGDLLPMKGEVVRNVLVTITKVYKDPAEAVLMMEFIHPDGWRGRIKGVPSGDISEKATAMGFDILSEDKARAAGGKPFPVCIERASVLWAKREAAFCIVGSPRRGAGTKRMVLSLPVDPEAVAEAEAKAKHDRLAREAANEERAASIEKARASIDTADLADPSVGHSWQRSIASASHICVDCGESVSELGMESMSAEQLSDAFGGTCWAKAKKPEPAVDDEASPEAHSEREALLPDFDDWQRKLSAF